MGGFRRAFLGYRREDVDTAIASRDARVAEWEKAVAERDSRLRAVDSELLCLSGMVLERERESALLRDQLKDAEERHDRSLDKLEVIIQRVEEMQAAARGHATRIRMKALREAIEVSERASSLTQRMDFAGHGDLTSTRGAETEEIPGPEGEEISGEDAGGIPVREAEEIPLQEGHVAVEVGPLS